MAGFTQGKIAGLNDAAMAGFTQGQIAELPTDAFGGFDYHKCESLNPDAMGGCTYAQFGKIPQGAMLGLGISHIKNLSSNTMGSLGMDDIEKFDPIAAVGLDPKNMGTTTLTAIMNKFKSSTLADRETVKFISSEFFQDMLHKDNTASTYSITNDLDGFLENAPNMFVGETKQTVLDSTRERSQDRSNSKKQAYLRSKLIDIDSLSDTEKNNLIQGTIKNSKWNLLSTDEKNKFANQYKKMKECCDLFDLDINDKTDGQSFNQFIAQQAASFFSAQEELFNAAAETSSIVTETDGNTAQSMSKDLQVSEWRATVAKLSKEQGEECISAEVLSIKGGTQFKLNGKTDGDSYNPLLKDGAETDVYLKSFKIKKHYRTAADGKDEYEIINNDAGTLDVGGFEYSLNGGNYKSLTFGLRFKTGDQITFRKVIDGTTITQEFHALGGIPAGAPRIEWNKTDAITNADLNELFGTSSIDYEYTGSKTGPINVSQPSADITVTYVQQSSSTDDILDYVTFDVENTNTNEIKTVYLSLTPDRSQDYVITQNTNSLQISINDVSILNTDGNSTTAPTYVTPNSQVLDTNTILHTPSANVSYPHTFTINIT